MARKKSRGATARGGRPGRSPATSPEAAPGVRGSTGAMPFPGRVVKLGDADTAVLALQRRLNRVGCGPVDEDGVFGPQTAAAVKLFQARFPDREGQPLKVDGVVGAITWAALFGGSPGATVPEAASPLLAEALKVAVSQLGVMEQPPGSNRGPEVDGYLKAAGLEPTQGSFPWCAAFVFWCFNEAAKTLGRQNPVVRTAGVLNHWDRAGAAGVERIAAAKAHLHEALVQPGHIFIIDTDEPGGGGHTGLIEQVVNGKLVTIEGNTNDGGAREGVGVFRRRGRRIRDVNVGFIDYSTR